MKIVIYACVYNSERTLSYTIESVLRQSYQDFEFHIEDNGSTDGTRAIIYGYADRDSRIVPHIRAVNHTLNGTPPPIFSFMPPDSAYFTNIDGDDWWEPDYLEQLLDFAERFHLDIACTGTLMHDMATGGQGVRSVGAPLVLEKRQFAEAFPYYHVFFRTIWGKLVRSDLIPKVCLPSDGSVYCYGADTVYSFQLLHYADRIGIHDSVLHHYRIDRKSVSGQYNPLRFESDVYLYNDAVDFLSAFGPISAQNRNFIQLVYANALFDTTGVIQSSNLPPAGKLGEYRAIASHPVTLETFRECRGEDAARSKAALLQRALEAGAALGKEPDDDLRLMMQTLLPRCGQIVTAGNAQLFLMDARLFRALLQDDQDSLLQILLDQVKKNQGVKKFAIPAALQALTVDDPLLCQIDDAVFLRKYGGIYWKVWQGEYTDALDEMTGMLLEKHINGGQEAFLQMYISLAAVMEQPPAFIFGRIQLACLCLRQGRLEECQAIVDDLTEMGAESANLDALKLEMDRLKEK